MISNKSAKRIEFSPIFRRQLERASFEIKITFRETFEVFIEDPYHPSLRNHALTEEYAGIRSIDINQDIRVLYREVAERIIFIELGTHEELYG